MPRMPRRQKFWAQIRGGAFVTLLCAVGLTFASMGFLNDVTAIDRQPFSSAFYRSLITGVVAVTVIVAVARSYWWFVPAFLVFVAGSVFLEGPARHEPFVAFLGVTPQVRLQIDSALAVLAVISGYNAFIVFITREGRRQVASTTELELAQRMHRSLVPRIDASIGPVRFHGVSDASGPVGGDIVDVVELPGCQWCAYVADVSGHGVSSGLVMGMVKSAVRMALDDRITLSTLVGRLNGLLCSQLSPGTYVTFAAIRGGADGPVEFLSAGHPPLMRVSAATGRVEELATDNAPLGISSTWVFESMAVEPREDLLVLITDGLFEVFDKRDDQFGLDAVKDVLTASSPRPLEATGRQLFERARAFGPQHDDQSLLLVQRTMAPGGGGATMPAGVHDQ